MDLSLKMAGRVTLLKLDTTSYENLCPVASACCMGVKCYCCHNSKPLQDFEKKIRAQHGIPNTP